MEFVILIEHEFYADKNIDNIFIFVSIYINLKPFFFNLTNKKCVSTRIFQCLQLIHKSKYGLRIV